MADSRRSAGGVAPRSFYDRSRPSRVTPYGPSKVPHRRSIHYGPPPHRRSIHYGPPAIGPSKVPHRRSIECDPPAIGPSKVPPRRSIECDPPAIGPSAPRGSAPSTVPPSMIPLLSEVPPRRGTTQYDPPAIGPSNVPPRRSIQYDPLKVPRSPLLRPAMDLSKVPPCLHNLYSYGLRPAMDLSKVPPCLHYLYPYGRAFRFLAGLPASTPYDAPAIGPSYVDLPANLHRSTPYDPPTTGTPCDPPAIGCHSTPPHDSPAIGCLNNPCDSPASSPSYMNNTPSPVSDSEITLDYDGRRCYICDGKRLHSSVQCPCLVLAAQLDVVKDNPPKKWEYYRYVVRNEWEGMDGYGVGFYDPPKKGDAERSAADAMRQYEEGMNMIRMTGLPENNRDPERLCRQLEKKFGPVAHAVVFPDQRFGFVKFVNRDSAQKAIELLNNYSDCGHLMWAMQSPE